ADSADSSAHTTRNTRPGVHVARTAVRDAPPAVVARIILTRPAVEAGERLGYLPGTLTDKIDPYLRPLYDALNEMLDPDLVPK
ncbi:PhoH family protein, partial [Pantoea sp. SIMBA_079]|uniref:PhoH family protein n=1 Tax=Pantoea sp. SIMBA_079 TaxID=3085817 RepID=UPI003996A3BD